MKYALKLEDYMRNENSADGMYHSDFHEPRTRRFGEYLDKMEWCWDIKIAPVVNRILAIIFGVLSIIIIISECTLSFSNTYDSVVYGLFKYFLTGSYIQAMLCTLLLLGYLCFCTFFGIFNFKVSGFYGLYSDNQTEPSNLVYSAL